MLISENIITSSDVSASATDTCETHVRKSQETLKQFAERYVKERTLEIIKESVKNNKISPASV